MIWSGWNKADKTLLLALALFFFALCLHLQYPDKLLADGFLFCTEAALVGGIADWFAVTALFRRPLGFPYHTAILPRRRDSFIAASVTLVQKEFFSRRKIFLHLDKFQALPLLQQWLERPETEQLLLQKLQTVIRGFAGQQDIPADAGQMAAGIRRKLRQLPPDLLAEKCAAGLKALGKDKLMLCRLAQGLRPLAERESVRAAIGRILEQYGQERIQNNPLAALFAGIATAVNLVNYEEAAGLMQKQLVQMLDNLADENSELHQTVLAALYKGLEETGRDPAAQSLLADVWQDAVKNLPLEKILIALLQKFQQQAMTDELQAGETGAAVQSWLWDTLHGEYRSFLQAVSDNEKLRHSIESFLYDMIARSALHAQTMVGVIVREVLSCMTDEQLNRLVYDKAEPDLLWIRMNGSIVGAGLGLVLFVLIQIVPLCGK